MTIGTLFTYMTTLVVGVIILAGLVVFLFCAYLGASFLRALVKSNGRIMGK